jgi:tetratricopeptide (TPR) repeat protein
MVEAVNRFVRAGWRRVRAPISARRDEWSGRIRWVIPFVIALITLAAFWPALRNGFVAWDDEANFISNPNYRGLGWTQLRWMFTTFHLGPYQPLCWLTFALDYELWGMNPWGYHLSSVLLHALNACLFYLVSKRLLCLGLRDLNNKDEVPVAMASAFSALLFAVHPLRVESVAWVTERKDVLSGSFFLATLLLYLTAYVEPADIVNRRRLQGATILCYILSLSAKAMGMTLPIVLLILDIYPLRRLAASPRQWFLPQSRPIFLEKIPFLLAASVAAAIALVGQRHGGAEAMALVGQRHGGAMPYLAHYGAVLRLEQPFFGLAFYLAKTLAPMSLLPLYEIPANFRLPLPTVLLSGGVVLTLSMALWSLRRRWPAGLAAWAYYVVTVLPVLGVFSFGRQLAADRYTYLPCLSWAVLGGGAVFCIHRKASVRGRILLAGALCSSIAALSFLTWRQTKIWHDSMTLWEHILSVNPECRTAHDNLAEMHFNLGNELTHQGRLAEAITQYRKALGIMPDYDDAQIKLGIALAGQGRTAEAIAQFQQELARRPDNVTAHNNLGIALARQGRLAEAMTEYQRALGIKPDYAEARHNLGVALAGQGRMIEAITQYRKALDIKPDYADARINLGVALAGQGRTAEAIAQFQQELARRPDDFTAHNNLGIALASQGRLAEAVMEFQQALAIKPDYALAQDNLRRVLRRP